MKIGDRVYLRESSEYYPEQFDPNGGVITMCNVSGWDFQVKWNTDGNELLYDKKDLILKEMYESKLYKLL